MRSFVLISDGRCNRVDDLWKYLSDDRFNERKRVNVLVFDFGNDGDFQKSAIQDMTL